MQRLRHGVASVNDQKLVLILGRGAMYSPKIREDLIGKLYRLGKRTGQPMTKVVDRILRQALEEAHGEHPIPQDSTGDRVHPEMLRK